MSAIIAILKNPAYAGTFVYGRRFTTRAPLPGARGPKKRRARSGGSSCDRYPAYVTWETFEKIQDMLRDNHAEYRHNKTRGIPRPGAALLHGLVYCGECGHKMVVQYKAGTRYICNYLRQQHGVPVCQYLAADPIDAWVVAAFLEAVAPAELEAWERPDGTAPGRRRHDPRRSPADRAAALSGRGAASVQQRRSRQPAGRSRVGTPLRKRRCATWRC